MAVSSMLYCKLRGTIAKRIAGVGCGQCSGGPQLALW